MARLPRLTLPGYAHHVIQRGNNRQAIFHDDADYRQLLTWLGEYAKREKVAIHAYVLMSNHFHLLATPQTERGLSLMMQALGRRYAQYFNRRHARTGTLWEGRYRSTLIDTDAYLLACMAYIDLNPVRAGLVAAPGDYPWSSHLHYVGLKTDPLVSAHPFVWNLGNTPFAREAAYGSHVHQGVARTHQIELTDATLKGWALGSSDFKKAVQKQTHRRISPVGAGRPRLKPRDDG